MRINPSEITLRWRFAGLLICALLPALVWAGQLTAVRSAYHAKGNYTILVLSFDESISQNLTPSADGAGLQLILSSCSASQEVIAELTSLSDNLIKGVEINSENQNLRLQFRFSGPMKVRTSETSNPYHLNLDISPVPAAKANPPAAAPGVDSKRKIPPAVKSNPSEPTAQTPKRDLLAEGKKALSENREREALEAFEQALKQSPDLTEAHFLLGLLLRKWGQPEAAIGHFQKAKIDTIYFSRSSTELASIYRQLGRTNEEVAEWEAFFAAMKGAYAADDTLAAEKIKTEEAADSSSTITTKNDSLTISKPKKAGGLVLIVQYVSLAAIFVLALAMIWLYSRQRELYRTLKVFLEKEGEERIAPSEQPVATLPQREVPISAPSPASEETAREIQSLYKAGMSIPAIAEKLGMGQDEVRLILNLMRDEKG